MIRNFIQEIKGINLIDIGSSGNLDPKWDTIRSHINLVGFDPNEEECKRMSELPNDFRSVQYVPFAIAGEKGTNRLYKTKSIYCYSLLKPNTPWLQRFSFHDLFEIVGETDVETRPLSDIPALQSIDVDVVKTDTQGLELPVLRSSGKILDDAFMVETETGFTENYHGETTYAQIDEFMRSNGFLLFDINTTHRIPRNNIFKDIRTGSEQLLWCEAVWLKDYIALAEQGRIKKDIGRQKMLKALILCSLQGCIDYGFEIASLARDLDLVTPSEISSLQSANAWKLDTKVNSRKSYPARLVNVALRLLPTRFRAVVRDEAVIAVQQRHLLRF